jgi:FtsH-binding integral membrane protein
MPPSKAGHELAAATKVKPQARRSSRSWFFVCMSIVLLIIVAVGFAKSFYLRTILHKNHAVSTLPVYIVLHGIVLTSWFLLFAAQTWLVASGKVRLHRSLGFAGAVLAPVVFALSLLVVVRSVVRETSLVVIGDIVILFLFAILVTAGICFRQKPDVHKRLMLIASISIVAPAIARWPGAQSMLPVSVAGPQLLLFATLVLYDFSSRRRVHRATVWGLALYFVAVGTTLSLASSKLGHALIEALR